MIERLLPRAALAAILLFATQLAVAQLPVPPLKARVTDLTGTLTADQRAALEAKLASFESRKGSQVAVLIVTTTQPEVIEQYAIQVAEQWRLGRRGVDDGVLLLVAKNDRKLRIEVGRGLEGAIPDAIAKRIIADVITPHFKEGDFYGGIIAGTDQILRAIEGEVLPLPPTMSLGKHREEVLFFGFIILTVITLAFANVLPSLMGRLVGAGIVGGISGFVVYFFTRFVPFAVLVGIIFFAHMLFNGKRSRRGGFWSSNGGWSSGGGWSSSGGGFSGGGGGFSGGGASGSW